MTFSSSSLLPILLLLPVFFLYTFTTLMISAGDQRRRILTEENDDNGFLDVDNEKVLSTRFFTEWKVYDQHGLKEKNKITSLPGQPPEEEVGFGQYGGYVTVDKAKRREIFYYLVLADLPNPSLAPLLLWLNGGPGCSALIGAFQEVGPFRVRSDGRTLFKNPYAWNKVANVLFMEYPAGVGFSRSGDKSEYFRTGDTKTVEDGYGFLVNWLERFPEYKGRDFYIAGESYGGHYVCQLATLIHRFNLMPGSHHINLKGIAIGNGVLNDKAQARGFYDYLWTHAFISDEVNDDIHNKCEFDNFGFVMLKSRDPKCATAINSGEVAVVNGIDMFNIYAPVCTTNTVTDVPKETSIDEVDPCIDQYQWYYINLREVKQAMNADVNYPWTSCGNFKGWGDSPKDVLPLLKELLGAGIRILVYSGDVDARVPVTSTRYALALLKLPITTPWSLWKVNREVAGFSQVYEGNLTFATVRGAGHKVPSDQPLRSLELLRNFIAGTPLPSK